MVREERHNRRDLRYSKWHRDNLPNYCYATDLDWIEWRPDKGIVAFVETKIGWDTPITSFQEKVFAELEEKSGVPVFVVNHTEKLDQFKVSRRGRVLRLDEVEFIEFMKQLGEQEEPLERFTSMAEVI